jgi:indolepyruvate ferredoxin oxidoreductase beta subunit
MAQRGGSVISTIKLGGFHSPLLRRGQADLGIFLHPDNLPVHGHLLAPGAPILLNTPKQDHKPAIDATGLAAEMGSPVLANLILLGFGAGNQLLFCAPEELRETIAALSGTRSAINLKAFDKGLQRA